ncbi:AraC family transcriptional regulator [Sporanaerobium hydrogeniformans]|uniref:AraC family transcriptional regulator n=1 Tax=Sporanaerobium hydrogeniformans TaxID=3072179 RepID=UPI0015D4DA96|nr:AraC family transcriptional regulator [Sporanaerobium hydrogeniformans]
MKAYETCKEAIANCLSEKRFAVAKLFNQEKTLDMHIHDCFELYIALTGSRCFFIDQCSYEVKKGDVFVINQYESHYLRHKETEPNERLVLSINPEFLAKCSSEQTDLCQCFTKREGGRVHQVSTTPYELQYIQTLVNKMLMADGYGSDVIEEAVFKELMVFINRLFWEQHQEESIYLKYPNNELIGDLLEYINAHIHESFSIETLAKDLFISSSYACRLFKRETGTTISKYITARRISIAKAMLASGCSVKEACEGSGFNDYANFIKTFSKMVGISPKKYSKCNLLQE